MDLNGIKKVAWDSRNLSQEEFNKKIELFATKQDKIEVLENIACFYMGIKREDIHTKSRVGNIPDTLKIIWKILNDKDGYFNFSKCKISKKYNRDRTTIISGLKKVNNYIETDKEFARVFQRIFSEFKNTISNK